MVSDPSNQNSRTTSRDVVTGVVCLRRGETFTLCGKVIIPAAGALETPCRLKPYRLMLLKPAENSERVARACGTCGFGTDPRTSVLDANNRAHGLAN